MAAPPPGGKLYPSFTIAADNRRAGVWPATRDRPMVGIAAVMFVALFGWGAEYFGWADPDSKVQLALATAFVLGAVCGYKSRD
jgi:hypothetical protein